MVAEILDRITAARINKETVGLKIYLADETETDTN